MGYSPPGSSVHGILQARVLEWGAIVTSLLFFFPARSEVKSFSRLRLFATLWTVAAPGSSVHGILQARILEWGAMPSSRGLPNPGIEPRSPALQADSLPSESPGKPKKTGVGSLFLLQGIFSIQESNQGLLHCRLIFYQLSYQGSPQR